MTIRVAPTGAPCGARVTGVDLGSPLDPSTVKAIRSAWLDHHVLAFPDQQLSDDDLERFTVAFGGFGHDPYIEPVDGRQHVIAIHRSADETLPVFAENWHSDWSFQAFPPAGTCLYGIVIPPVGGDTLFANQHLALERMPVNLRHRVQGLTAIHSARFGYAPDSRYGQEETGQRGMRIVTSPTALETQTHPLVQTHPETGRPGLFSCMGYIIGFEELDEETNREVLAELHAWQTRDEFVYRHSWKPDMLIMWDNRSVIHKATAGYDGYDRLLHRTTIAAWRG
ncbi:MAG: TauD/TfdA dioxygenase family protein [Acidimicrobiales bacterium]